jgi:hypothetical protein
MHPGFLANFFGGLAVLVVAAGAARAVAVVAAADGGCRGGHRAGGEGERQRG